MDNLESGTILYRNEKCNNDRNDSSLYPKKTATTKDSATISRNPNNIMETKTPNVTPNRIHNICPEHGGRTYPSKNQCYQYKILLRRIKSLIDEINAIRKNETTGICDFCKRYNSMGTCKRCEILGSRDHKNENIFIPRHQQQAQKQWPQKQLLYLQQQQISNKYEVAQPDGSQNQQKQRQMHSQHHQDELLPNMYATNDRGYSEYLQKQKVSNKYDEGAQLGSGINQQRQQQMHSQQKQEQLLPNKYGFSEQNQENRTNQQQRFMLWLSKVKQFLFSVLESEATQHKLFHNKDSDGTDDLTNLLNELKLPLNVREPYIRQFSPSLELLENLNESNDIFKEVVQKLRNEKHYFSDTSMDVMPCPSTCKYFAGRKLDNDSDQNIAGDLTNKVALKDKGKLKILRDSKTKGAKAQENSKITANKKEKPVQPQTGKKAKATTRELNDDKGEGDISNEKDKGFNQNIKEENKSYKRDKGSKQDNGAGDKRKDNKDADQSNMKGVKDKGKDYKDADKSNTKGVNDKGRDNKKADTSNTMGDKDKGKYNKEADKSNKKGKDTSNKQPQEKESLNDIQKMKGGSKPTREKETKEKGDKSNINAEDQMMAAMMKSKLEAREKKEKEKAVSAPPKLFPKIDELPPIKEKVPIKVEKIESEVISESVMECNLHITELTKMIQGTEIVPIKPRNEDESMSVQPIMFKVKQEYKDEGDGELTITSTATTASKSTKTKSKVEATESKSNKGVISYRLSNKEFIEKGWTLLPTTNIMQRMNVYKMLPAQPQYDWFKNHQYKGLLTYDTGEKLAEIDDSGSGRWYYKNGKLALDYYSSQEINSGHRYVVYSSGEKDAFGRKQPITVLASFDYVGNGVVYDQYGNERLKYNQSEGVVIDSKIGAPGHWKWHTLNDPPVLQPQFIDTYAKSDVCIEKLLRSKNADRLHTSSKQKEPDLDMITIELENIVREKANKLLQEFKPFQIRMKALKINDQFSLKVLDQSNIYLIFREGQKSMKLNLGLLLLSNEIVDTVVAELNQVVTPYDFHPPKSQSIAEIQKIVEKANHFGKIAGFNERGT